MKVEGSRVGLVVAALVTSACISPTPLPDSNGYAFCQEIGDQMRQVSSGWAIAGWLMVCCIVAAIGAGNLMGNDWGNSNSTWYCKAKGALTLVFALSLVPFAYYALSRSSSSADAAAAAETGLTADTSKQAYNICVTTKASWISSRVTSNAIGESTLKAVQQTSKQDNGGSKKAASQDAPSAVSAEPTGSATATSTGGAESLEVNK